MHLKYRLRKDHKFAVTGPDGQTHPLPAETFLLAVESVHEIVDRIDSFDINIAEILGMRNLSAFIGELFVARLVDASSGLFLKNPHQDGYPDLMLLDKIGQQEVDQLERSGQMKAKGPFSPFISGGVEVKATCGAVPTPKECAKKGRDKPGIGDERISFLKGYDWKAHHRETNNLAGILWDFVEGKARIVGVFFSDNLVEDDWGKIVTPKAGGGRTTSVSVMTRMGVQKMFCNWVLVTSDKRYRDFLNRYNKVALL